MHRSDGRLDLQAFRQLQEIGARDTASEHVVEGQRHAHIDSLITLSREDRRSVECLRPVGRSADNLNLRSDHHGCER